MTIIVALETLQKLNVCVTSPPLHVPINHECASV